MTTSREIRLKSRPVGLPKASDFELASVDLPAPGDGEVQVRNLWMSVDPYMRGRMYDRPSYVPPFQIGQALQGGAIGEVIASNDPDFKPGDVVSSMFGWREAFNAHPKSLAAAGMGVELEVGGKAAGPGLRHGRGAVMGGEIGAEFRVGGKAQDVAAELGVIRREQALAAFGEPFAHAAGAHRNDRQARGACLQCGEAKGFQLRGQREQVAAGQQGLYGRWRNGAKEFHFVRQAETARLSFKSRPLRSVAGQAPG